MDMQLEDATTIVNELVGFGPVLYTRTRHNWMHSLGCDRGIGLDTLVLSKRRLKGYAEWAEDWTREHGADDDVNGCGIEADTGFVYALANVG